MDSPDTTKKSSYNHLTKEHGQWVLYNAATDEICVLDPQLKLLYQQENSTIAEQHPAFYEHLCVNHFIVPIETDEAQACIAQWKAEDSDPSTFSIIINPTLDCNMRCWYCYEHHAPHRTMNHDTLEHVIEFVRKKIEEPRLQQLNLSFFGGEPLVQYEKIVAPILKVAARQTKQYNKKLHIGFTTNGYAVRRPLLEFLREENVTSHFQITLDGNRAQHDKTRYVERGRGSYDQILHNCALLLQNERTTLTLRCNYTTENLPSFFDLEQDLKLYHIEPSPHLNINFHRVWQDCTKVGENLALLADIRHMLQGLGYNVSQATDPIKYRCYADKPNHIVINYDGAIYHCTARDFTPERAEGRLTDNGEILFNERAELRNQLKWGNKTCMKCRIYPLCHGSCSQHLLENASIEGCVMGHSEEKKTQTIENRVRFLIEQAMRHQ